MKNIKQQLIEDYHSNIKRLCEAHAESFTPDFAGIKYQLFVCVLIVSVIVVAFCAYGVLERVYSVIP